MTTTEARKLAKQLAAMGERNDVILAHISPREAVWLAKYFGGDINPHTGLPQFDFFSSIGKDLGSIVSLPVTATEAVVKGVGSLAGGAGSVTNPGQQQFNELTQITQPLTSAAQQQLQQYSSGQLSPSDQLSLNAQTNAAKAAANQFYASAGLGNSSMIANQTGNLDIQAAIAKGDLLNGYLGNAERLYGIALGPYQSALQSQLQGQLHTQDLLSSGLGSIFQDVGIPALTSLFSGSSGTAGAEAAWQAADALALAA